MAQADEQIIFQASLLEQVCTAVIATTLEGEIIFWNRHAEAIYQRTSSEVIGQLFCEIVVPVSDRQAATDILHQVKQGNIWQGEFPMQRRDKSRFLANCAVSPLKDATNRGVGLLVTVMESKITETTLRHQIQERTAQLQQAMDFETLLRVTSEKVWKSLDEVQIVRTVAQELLSNLPILCCSLALYELEQESLVVCYEYVADPSLPPRHTWQMTEFPEIHAQTLDKYCFQFCLISHPGYGQVEALVCPLTNGQEVLGSVILFRAWDDLFSELEVRLLKQVANQCAIAIHQARLQQVTQAQVQKLEQLNRLKDDFLSTVSHELRTPVSNMKMAIHMLKLATTPDRQARYLEILHTECLREAELIDDLLDLQRLEGASYPVFLIESIVVAEWLFTIMEPFQSRAQERQQILKLNLSLNLPNLLSDRASLGRILAELLNNACKYTPAGGRIMLSVHHESQLPALTTELGVATRLGVNGSTPHVMSVITFTLSNEVEIPEAELPRIFDKFYRIPHADPWKQGGTGLGLALVQRLVERLRGTIVVESDEGWTTFTIHLPTRPDDRRGEELIENGHNRASNG